MSFLIILRHFRSQKTHLRAFSGRQKPRKHGIRGTSLHTYCMTAPVFSGMPRCVLLRFLRCRKIFPSLLHPVEGAQAGGRHGAVFFENPGKVKFVFKTALVGNFTDPEM